MLFQAHKGTARARASRYLGTRSADVFSFLRQADAFISSPWMSGGSEPAAKKLRAGGMAARRAVTFVTGNAKKLQEVPPVRPPAEWTQRGCARGATSTGTSTP